VRHVLYLILVVTLVFQVGCGSSGKLATLKPEPDDASPLFYENAPSYINLPISVKLKDIENQTNQLLNSLIFEDNNIEDDDMQLKIWKQAPIKILNDPAFPDKKIKTVLPLKIFIRYRIGTEKLGIKMYDIREFNLNGVLTLSSETILNNWKLTTKTEFKSLDWNESPTMTILGRNMPITYLVNPAISIFKSKIEKNIDQAIEKSMDFKPNVLAALEKICTPFEMNETYESWLRIVPIEIYATTAKLKNDHIMLDMGMKCKMETIIGKKPESQFNSAKVILKPVTKIPNQITTNIVAISGYSDASKVITKNFAGQEFGSGSKKVRIQNVSIWHKNQKMIIALDVLGSVNGTLYLNGSPQYNPQTKEIYFDQLDYVLDTKSKLMRTANWLAQGLILKKIQENCRYSILPNLEEGKKTMANYLNNYSPMPGVFINGKMEDIQFDKIQLTNQAIIAFIKINGTVNVSVDGLK
jgi:hypothetical protein